MNTVARPDRIKNSAESSMACNVVYSRMKWLTDKHGELKGKQTENKCTNDRNANVSYNEHNEHNEHNITQTHNG